MAGQGDSPLSNAWLSRKRYRRSQTAALIKQTSTDAGAAVWDDYFFPAASGGAITGTLSATLANVTLSSQGALAIAGVTNATLAAVTLSSQGALAISGTASVTLGDVTLVSASALAITGTLAITLADVTASGAGAVAITGTESSTLDNVTLLATGALSIVGTMSATLDNVTLAATGELEAVAETPVVSRGASYFVSEKSRRKREKEKLDERELLDRAVREAYLIATGQQIEAEPTPEPPKLTTATREKIAKAIKTEYRDEITASISEIRARIKAMEKELAQAAKDEDEFEMFMLMAA